MIRWYLYFRSEKWKMHILLAVHQWWCFATCLIRNKYFFKITYIDIIQVHWGTGGKHGWHCLLSRIRRIWYQMYSKIGKHLSVLFVTARPTVVFPFDHCFLIVTFLCEYELTLIHVQCPTVIMCKKSLFTSSRWRGENEEKNTMCNSFLLLT